ncbi:MAG: hypothetical protein OXT67_04105 [Zetaproteobacteria bacterium]|nr:hypothetical protein [Zetaproteobacteria bacterium]
MSKYSSKVLLLCVLLVQTLCSGCVRHLQKISGRQIGPQPSEVQPNLPIQHVPAQSQLSENIYKKDYQRKIVVAPQEQDNPSLYRLDAPENKLFNEDHVPKIGQKLIFKVVDSKKLSQSEKDPLASEEETPADDLIASIPSLAPPAEDESFLMEEIPMRIEQILPNGDFLLRYTKSTRLNKSRRTLNVHAILPAEKYPYLKGSETRLTTRDLQDVELTDIYKHDTQIFSSQDWDNAYTLRLSNYHEQRNAYAIQLENKRRQLEGIRDKVEQRAKNSNKQRKKWTAEREKWQRLRAKEEKKFQKLNSDLQDKQDTITQQQEVISQLQDEVKALRMQSQQTEAAANAADEGTGNEQEAAAP